MQRKTLVVACSAILGLSGGGVAFADECFDLGERCLVSSGNSATAAEGFWRMIKAHGEGTSINALDVYVLEGISVEEGATVNITTKMGLPEGTGLPAGDRSTINKMWASGDGSTLNVSNSLIAGWSNDPWRRLPIGVWNNADLGGMPSVFAGGGATITLDNVDVVGAVAAGGNGRLVMNGGSIREVDRTVNPENHYFALGVEAGSVADVTLTDVEIEGHVGLYAYDGGNVTINGGSIETKGPGITQGTAVEIGNPGRVVFDGTSFKFKDVLGINTSGTDVSIRNFDLLTDATKPVSGIFNSGELVLENGRIRTEGDQVVGILATDGQLTATNLDIATAGEQAHGVHVSGGEIELNNVDIAVASSDGIHIAAERGWRPYVEMNGGSIAVNGPGGHGVLSDTRGRNAMVQLNGVNIAIGADSYALGFVGRESGAQGSWIALDTSNAVAAQSTAVVAKGGPENMLQLSDSTLEGDRLVQVEAYHDVAAGEYYRTNLYINWSRHARQYLRRCCTWYDSGQQQHLDLAPVIRWHSPF